MMELAKKHEHSFIKIALAILYVLSPIAVNAFEFDDRILNDLGFDNVDLSTFSGENDRFSGEYIADVVINGSNVLNNYPLNLYVKDEISQVCFTEDLLKKLPIKDDVVKGILSDTIHITDAGKCLGFNHLDDTLAMSFDGEYQVLSLSVPQLYLKNYDLSWVSPEEREVGVSGIFIDYSLLAAHQRQKNNTSTTTMRSYGTTGVNIGALRFRGDYQYYSNSENNSQFDWVKFYAFTDIGSLNSKLYLGELDTVSNVFDNVRFKGISIYSDDNMRPANLTGYAPEVTGIANSNAIVTIRQRGQVIKAVQVPPGPFAIADLPSNISGILDVEVEESDGSTRSFELDVASVPFLSRKNSIRYSANIGKINPLNKSYDKTKKNFLSTDATYGLTNKISIYGGVLLTSNREYVAINAGIGTNLGGLGALSVDITQSKNKAEQYDVKKGQSYRFNYAKRFGSNTNLNLVGYRFSSRHFTTLSNYMDMKSGQLDNLSLEKNRISLNISQYFPSLGAGVSASLSRGTYWNKSNSKNYSVSAYTTIRKGVFENTSVQLSMSKTQVSDGRKETQYSLYLTIPVGSDRNNRIAYSAYYTPDTRQVVQSATYMDTAFGGDISLGAYMNHKRDFSGGVDYSLSSTYNKALAYGDIYLSGDYSDDSQYVSAGLDGSLTLTKDGLATHSKVGTDNARLIVGVGAPGVAIDGSENKSNIWGIAGVSNVATYYRMNYMVDNDALPETVEIQNGVMNLALTDGAIAYRSLNAISGEKAIVTIILPDGSHPPLWRGSIS